MSQPEFKESAGPLSVPALTALKGRRKISALTAYDAPTARLLDAAGIDVLLVGDSVEMVVYGAKNTLGASLDRMVAHTKAVTNAVKRALVVGDMPYLTYHTALSNGLPIASGVIEGACRHLVNHRMNLTGARWSLQGAEAVLRLRAVRSSEDL